MRIKLSIYKNLHIAKIAELYHKRNSYYDLDFDLFFGIFFAYVHHLLSAYRLYYVSVHTFQRTGGYPMTVNGSSLMSSMYQMSSNSPVQSQSGASGMQSTSGASSQAGYANSMQQALSGLMNTLDTNKDGTIDQSEFTQAVQNLSQKTNQTYDAQAAFQNLDKNQNGSLSSDELLSAMQQAREKNTHHHHHEQSSTQADTTTAQNSATNDTQNGSTSSNIQNVLLQKILSAYGSSSTLTTPSTSLTA